MVRMVASIADEQITFLHIFFSSLCEKNIEIQMTITEKIELIIDEERIFFFILTSSVNIVIIG